MKTAVIAACALVLCGCAAGNTAEIENIEAEAVSSASDMVIVRSAGIISVPISPDTVIIDNGYTVTYEGIKPGDDLLITYIDGQAEVIQITTDGGR